MPLPLGVGPVAEDLGQSESEDEEEEEDDGRYPADTALIEVCSSYNMAYYVSNLFNNLLLSLRRSLGMTLITWPHSLTA